MSLSTTIALIIVAVALIALLVTGTEGTVLGFEADMFARVAMLAAMAFFVGSGLIRRGRGQLPEALRNIAIWLVIALVLVAGYAYKAEFAQIGRRVMAVLVPGTPISAEVAGRAEVTVARAADGHFRLDAKANGASVSFLVDSGASTVTLTEADAAAAGIDLSQVVYSTPIQTANGRAFAAPTRIRELAVGGIVERDLDALIARSDALDRSLLGMNFLDRLSSWAVGGDRLTLRQ